MQHTPAAAPPIVMSGMRPTGLLHLGHYMGVLRNWVALQQQYPCYFMIADWHALTTKLDDTQHLATHTLETLIDWLACGLDPEKSTLYVQSSVPAIAELHLLLSMATPNKWLETDPTLKDMVALLRAPNGAEASGGGELTYGLLGYPLLQTADILAMGGSLVPVGKDQVAHLEISRDIARRFNHLLPPTPTDTEPLFVEPKPLLSDTPVLLGLDGRKMSKSYNNTIFLKDSDDETWAKLKTAVTDAQRVRKEDPGDPEACVGVFPNYRIFAEEAEQEQVAEACRKAAWGCMACKKQLAERINEALRPVRERRAVFENDPAQLQALLKAGAEAANAQAGQTLQRLKRRLNLLP